MKRLYVKKYPSNLTPPANYGGSAFALKDHLQGQMPATTVHKASRESAALPSDQAYSQNAPLSDDLLSEDLLDGNRIPSSPNGKETDSKNSSLVEKAADTLPSMNAEQPSTVTAPDDGNLEQTEREPSDLFAQSFSFEEILILLTLLLACSGQTDNELLLLAGIFLLTGRCISDG